MADQKFVSTVPSGDFDAALLGGLAFARGEFVSPEQQAAFVENLLAALPTYNGEVEDV